MSNEAMSDQRDLAFSTRCIHGGQAPDPRSGAVMPPIVLSSTFMQSAPGEHQGWDYSRAGNPTRDALEAAFASLEGAKYGFAFGSGCAATTTILLNLKAGDHVLVGDDVYGGTFRLFRQVLDPIGIHSTFCDMTDLDTVRGSIRPETRMIWMETPSNPLLKIFDIAKIAEIAEGKKLALCVDNTFATPALQSPLALGATLAVHSTTKYLNGHSDAVGGAVMTSDDGWADKLRFLQKSVGAVPSPFDCYMVLRGIKTLALRMDRHVASATALASWLAAHPDVERVLYPGLDSHPGHALAAKQMRAPGGMISFEPKGGLPAAKALLESLSIFTLAESLGGVESLAEHPAIMTHASIPKAEREAIGISDALVRLSVGVEDRADLQADLERGLRAAKNAR